MIRNRNLSLEAALRQASYFLDKSATTHNARIIMFSANDIVVHKISGYKVEAYATTALVFTVGTEAVTNAYCTYTCSITTETGLITVTDTPFRHPAGIPMVIYSPAATAAEAGSIVITAEYTLIDKTNARAKLV